MINWVILNDPHRKDKRNVGVANALYANIHTDWISFFDAKSPRDYPSTKAVMDNAIEDGFPEFHNDAFLDKFVDSCDLIDVWNLLRYFRSRAENPDTQLDLFIKGDVYFRQIGHELLTEHFLLIAREHLLKYCEREGLDFCYLIFSAEGIKSKEDVTGYCFLPGKTPTVDVQAAMISQVGASILEKRLRARLRNYDWHQTNRFREYVFRNHNIPGGFSTSVQTIELYPIDFLGDDMQPDRTAYQGEFARLFPKERDRYYD